MRFKRALLAVAAMSLFALSSVDATVYVLESDEGMVDFSRMIAVVDVLSVDDTASDRHGTPMTAYELYVREQFKGKTRRGPVTVHVLGGVTADGMRLVIPDAPRFEPGERALLFMRQQGGVMRLTHMAMGAFYASEQDGEDVWVRRLDASGDLSRRDSDLLLRESLRKGHHPRAQQAFMSWIKDRTDGIERKPDYFVAPPDAGITLVTQPFTRILNTSNGLPIRQPEFDSGDSVDWLTSGTLSGFGAIVAATNNAWKALNKIGSINYKNTGKTKNKNGFNEFAGLNVIVTNNPKNQIEKFNKKTCSGVLAAAGPWMDAETTHSPGRQTFSTAFGADMVWNKGLKCFFDDLSASAAPPADRMACGNAGQKGAEQITAHEGGHTLGLDHACGDDSSPECETSTKLAGALMAAFFNHDKCGAKLNGDDKNGLKNKKKGMAY